MKKICSFDIVFLARHVGRITLPLRICNAWQYGTKILRDRCQSLSARHFSREKSWQQPGAILTIHVPARFPPAKETRTRDFRLLFTLALSRHNPGQTLRNGKFYDPPVSPPPRKHERGVFFRFHHFFISCNCWTNKFLFSFLKIKSITKSIWSKCSKFCRNSLGVLDELKLNPTFFPPFFSSSLKPISFRFSNFNSINFDNFSSLLEWDCTMNVHHFFKF